MREQAIALMRQLEALNSPDRDFDVRLLTTLGGYRDVGGDGYLFDRGNDGYWTLEGDEKNRPLPCPTGSLDDAVALFRHCFPQWGLDVGFPAHLGEHGGQPWADVWPSRTDPDEQWARTHTRPTRFHTNAATPPLALLCAMLKALAVQPATELTQ